MSSPERILTAVRALEPQLPLLLGEEAASVQLQITPLMEQVAAGQADGDALLQVLSAYPAIAAPLQQMLDLQQPVDESELTEILHHSQ